MINKRIEGFTRELGKAQGYFTLYIKDVVIGEPGSQCPAMQSAWEPTPDELALLCAGAPIVITLLGNVHAPIQVGIGNLPMEKDE